MRAWTAHELAVLREHYRRGGALAAAARLPGRELGEITSMATLQGLARGTLPPRPPQRETAPARTAASCAAPRRRKKAWSRWSAEELEILREHYPCDGARAVHDRLPHRSIETIRAQVRNLGIRRLQ